MLIIVNRECHVAIISYLCQHLTTSNKMMTRNGILLATAIMTLFMVGCRESLEERGAREAKEYTRKHCPIPVDKHIVMDSMTFDMQSHTFGYCYTLTGELDDSAVIQYDKARELLLHQLRNSTHLKLYKEADYNFRYVYYSTKKNGTKLFETTFHPEDYR